MKTRAATGDGPTMPTLGADAVHGAVENAAFGLLHCHNVHHAETALMTSLSYRS